MLPDITLSYVCMGTIVVVAMGVGVYLGILVINVLARNSMDGGCG